jgi:2-dehydropantoate 2-reductase
LAAIINGMRDASPQQRLRCLGMGTRIGIMGAGAIGSVIGGMLARAGQDVTLIDQWPAHVDAINQRGLQLSGTCGEHLVPVRALHLYEAQGIREPFDVMFLSVKGYDTDWATLFAVRFLEPGNGFIVDAQNGMNDERVARLAGRERTLGLVMTIGAGLYEPGHAMRTDTSAIGFKVGELDGSTSARGQQLVELLEHVAPTRLTTNLFGERWSKLATNCMANPLAGLSGYGSAEIRTEPLPRRIAVHLAAEVMQVGGAAGYTVEPIYGIEARRFIAAASGEGLEDVEADLSRGAKSFAGGRPSLLQDVMRGRRTEIEELNGFVVAEGQRLGVPTPFNAAIVAEVKRFPVGTLKADPRNLEPLARLLPVAV